ncbi:MAG: hypothetical protein LAT57_03690 [Balneolales bacterium]|nr:hypothetical protein [Balneolales bacterium]
MRFILYFIFFYIFIKIVRRLIMGPRPKRTFHVNWGAYQQQQQGSAGQGQSNGYQRASSTDDGEPLVGGMNSGQRRVPNSKNIHDVQDAEFKEIND